MHHSELEKVEQEFNYINLIILWLFFDWKLTPYQTKYEDIHSTLIVIIMSHSYTWLNWFVYWLFHWVMTVIENNIYFSNLLIIVEDHPVVLSHPSPSFTHLPLPTSFHVFLLFLSSLCSFSSRHPHTTSIISPQIITPTTHHLQILLLSPTLYAHSISWSPLPFYFSLFPCTVTGANQIETADGKITKLEKLSAHERAGRARLLGT